MANFTCPDCRNVIVMDINCVVGKCPYCRAWLDGVYSGDDDDESA